MTKRPDTSSYDVSPVSTPDDKSERTASGSDVMGSTCMHDPTGFGSIRKLKYYHRDDKQIAASLECMVCGHERFIFGEQAMKDWIDSDD